MSDIKSELAAKRTKLEELKRRNNPSMSKSSSKDLTASVDESITAKQTENLSQKRSEIDNLLKQFDLPSGASQSEAEASTVQSSLPPSLPHAHRPKPAATCSVNVLNGVNILPKDNVNYSKCTQTEDSGGRIR